MFMRYKKQIIVYDDYNSKIYGGGTDIMNTITTVVSKDNLISEILWT